MKHCKHCNDELFTDRYETCMTCYEKNHTQANMIKTIDQYEGESMWYQKEIIKLQNELECYKKNGDVKSDVVKMQKDILDKTLFELPVGSIKHHTYESIPDRVKYYVGEYALLEQEKDAVDELIAETMNFFDNPKAGSILDNVTILIKMANKAMLDAWADKKVLEALQEEIKEHAANKEDCEKAIDYVNERLPNFYKNDINHTMYDTVIELIERLNKANLDEWVESEKLETLEKEIEVFYEYYAGFGAKKDLTSAQMLNHILQSVPNYKPTKEEYDLEDMKRHCNHYIKALTEITKKNRKAETCRLIALKALGELTDEDYQPELLIEENLALRMKVEDLETKLIDATLEKAFPKEPYNAKEHASYYP